MATSHLLHGSAYNGISAIIDFLPIIKSKIWTP